MRQARELAEKGQVASRINFFGFFCSEINGSHPGLLVNYDAVGKGGAIIGVVLKLIIRWSLFSQNGETSSSEARLYSNKGGDLYFDYIEAFRAVAGAAALCFCDQCDSFHLPFPYNFTNSIRQ